MLFITILKVALRSIWANKLRSFLAMLGIIIGVGSVIAMLAIATGAQKKALEQISKMGSNVIVVRAGIRGFGGVTAGTQQNLMPGDAEALLAEAPHIRQVSPAVNNPVQAKYMNKNNKVNLM